MSSSNLQHTLLRRGEVFYPKSLKDAFDAFRKVILLCDCNKTLRASSKRLGISSKDIPLPICHCKDYLSLPIDDPDSSFSDKEAIFKLATQPCSCGSGIQPCHNPAHIKALTNIANVHMAQKAYSKAVQYASLAITLAPHVPEGYLRMVTVIRQGGLHCTPDIASRCNWLDTQASHSVRTHGEKDHDMLKPIGRRIRRDIVRGVPVEIRQLILRQLSHVDICRAMRVSKAWKLICCDRQLWKDLKLVKNWRHDGARLPFRPGALNRIVKLSGYMATSLTIDGLWDFKFSEARLRAMLKALPELKILSLAGRHRDSIGRPKELRPLANDVPEFSDFWAAIWEDAPSTLTTLHLNSFNMDSGWDKPIPTLAESHFKNSLQELSLIQLNLVDAARVIKAVLNNGNALFSTLTIKDCYAGDDELHYHDMTINILKHVFFRSVNLDAIVLGGSFAELKWSPDWCCLERLILGKLFSVGLRFPTSDKLRSLELNNDGLNSAKHLMWTSEAPAPTDLEHFRCHFDPHGAHIQQLYDGYLLEEHEPLFLFLRPSIENGALRSLDLTFSKEIRIAVDKLFVEDQKAALRTLSCHDVIMPSIVSGFGGNCDDFLDWVKTFPNLTTVGAYPQKSENAYKLISTLMKERPAIKTIYTNVLNGAIRDEVLAVAKELGVVIVHADRVPEPVLKKQESTEILECWKRRR